MAFKCMIYAAKPFLHLLKVFVRRYGILRHLRFTRSVSGYELMHGPVLVLYMMIGSIICYNAGYVFTYYI